MKNFTLLQKLIVVLIMVSIIFVSFHIFKYFFYPDDNYKTFKIGAGHKNSESYMFAEAISKTMQRYSTDMRLEVMDTGGSSANINLLEEGHIDLAIAQVDMKVGPSASIVSNLYSDFYHLIVRKDANISSFADLKGKKMALADTKSGQWNAFWFVANHYGVYPADIKNYPFFLEDIAEAFEDRDIDAIFFLRAPMNINIKNIIKNSNLKLLSLKQTGALALKNLSLKESIIPKGTYNGEPPIPQEDINTLSVKRVLLANISMDKKFIKEITQTLYERQLELLKYTNLAGFVSLPNIEYTSNLPIHEGAKSFYERDNPSYFEENADFLALLITLGALISSFVLAVSRYFQKSQKNLADKYVLELMDIMKKIRVSKSLDFILNTQISLESMLEEVIHELDHDNVTVEGFQFFSFTWEKVYEMSKNREELLR